MHAKQILEKKSLSLRMWCVFLSFDFQEQRLRLEIG